MKILKQVWLDNFELNMKKRAQHAFAMFSVWAMHDIIHFCTQKVVNDLLMGQAKSADLP